MTYVTQTQQPISEQFLAQAKLDKYITSQANAITLEGFTIVKIADFDEEIYAGEELIASIIYDPEHLTQRWVVVVNKEEFRANTYMKCYRYICTQYKRGELPAKETETACTTGNEIMAQIANECEKFEFDLMDDGIYYNDKKLGEVGCSNGKWWVVRASSEHQERVSCDSVVDAVWSLRMMEGSASGGIEERVDCEKWLDMPVNELTTEQWDRLLEYYPLDEGAELVAA
jgi:hypothetical protein